MNDDAIKRLNQLLNELHDKVKNKKAMIINITTECENTYYHDGRIDYCIRVTEFLNDNTFKKQP